MQEVNIVYVSGTQIVVLNAAGLRTDTVESEAKVEPESRQVEIGTSFRANGESLPAMGTDPYVEYSLGIQRTWADKYTIFGQATGRHGERNDVEFSAGFRYAW